MVVMLPTETVKSGTGCTVCRDNMVVRVTGRCSMRISRKAYLESSCTSRTTVGYPNRQGLPWFFSEKNINGFSYLFHVV